MKWWTFYAAQSMFCIFSLLIKMLMSFRSFLADIRRINMFLSFHLFKHHSKLDMENWPSQTRKLSSSFLCDLNLLAISNSLPKLSLTTGQENAKSDIPYYSCFHCTELILPILVHKKYAVKGWLLHASCKEHNSEDSFISVGHSLFPILGKCLYLGYQNP